MGSVSSLIDGNSQDSKHCKASDHRLKEGASHHKKSGGCSLDELLKCGFSQSSSSSAHRSKGLSHSRSGRSEDFFYIKVSQKPKSAHHRGRLMEERETPDRESAGRPHPKLLLMPDKRLERSPVGKPPVYSSTFTTLNPSREASTAAGRSSMDHILCPLRKASSSNVGKQEISGTLSDSGRNSMSSLPTHSTSSSLRVSTGAVCLGNSCSPIGNSLRKGQHPNFPVWNIGNTTNLDSGYRPGLNSRLATKVTTDAGSPLCAEEPSSFSEAPGGIRSPITTDESLIEHLEQRLLEKETELQELQVSLEEKEADTCQLFEERQQHCAEEMEGLKQQCSSKLRQASQNAAKSHQALQMQIYQLQAENEKLLADVSDVTEEKELIELRLKSYEKENTQFSPTLEEIQWEVCQKTGEISLLKQQLRDCQTDLSHRLNEIVGLKVSLKESTMKVQELETQKKDQEAKLYSCKIDLGVCQNELHRKKNEAECLREKMTQLETDLEGIKQAQAIKPEAQKPKCNPEFKTQSPEKPTEGSHPCIQSRELEIKRDVTTGSLQREVDRLREQLREEQSAQERLASSFEKERQTWNKEKDKVIKYHKQLQINYLHMHKKNQDLERRLTELTVEVESRTHVGICYSSGLQTYDDVIATEI